MTFPLFAAIYVLKHPLWVLGVLFLAFCLVIYYPLADGKELVEVPEWYRNKYAEVRSEVVKKAVEGDNLGFISQSMQDDLKREVEEDSRPKSENYNKKIMREDKIEAKTSDLKKRGGFKKKSNSDLGNAASADNKEEVLQSQGLTGGLAGVLKGYQTNATDVNEASVGATRNNSIEGVLPENMADLLPPETVKDNVKLIEKDEALDEFDLL